MITFVNVFTVVPEKQAAAFQKSEDGVRVTAVAQWESEDHLQALRETQGFKDLHNPEFYDAIVSNDGHVYTVAAELEAL